MLTRRHLRVKVMQCIYALSLSEQGGLKESEEFLRRSIGQTFTLYLLVLAIFRELHQYAESQLALGATRYLKDGPKHPDQTRLTSNAV